jgi:sulfoxide reductase heme-binding subunit YedZ
MTATTTVLAGHEWWLVSRAAGITALSGMAASVGLGLANAARLVPRRLKARTVALHEMLALTSLGAILLHGLSLLGDHWLHPGLAGIAIPFAGAYRPAAVAAGIVAAYASAALGLSFYARRRIGARRWRRLHTFTLAAYALGVGHALTAGSDAGALWFRGLLLAPLAPLLVLAARRFLPKRPRPRPAEARA